MTEPAAQLPDADLQDASEFLRLVGITYDELGPTRVTGWFEVGPQHHQPFGILHGGILCSAVETFASVGAWMAVKDSGRMTVGVSNTTTHAQRTPEGASPRKCSSAAVATCASRAASNVVATDSPR